MSDRQLSLLDESALIVPSDVLTLLAVGAPVAIGVSGGKDSVACALAVAGYLASTGLGGSKVLVHADLGLVEWQDSRPSCERVAASTGWPLHVTRRRAGGMMERWESRWESSKRRYLSLSCVKLILPWSTPAMRFCTSELKSAPIASYLRQLFGQRPVLSVTGIRAQESAKRAKMPASKPNPRLHAGSLDWNPLLSWPVEQVFDTIRAAGLPLHEAYTTFGSSRVSCAFCIMASGDDLRAALRDRRNLALYRRMCALELESAFAFQSGKWLSDLAPAEQVQPVEIVRQRAAAREQVETTIPKHLLFTKGWPEVMPTPDEAELLARVRRGVCHLYGWEPTFATGEAVLNRYAELMREKEAA